MLVLALTLVGPGVVRGEVAPRRTAMSGPTAVAHWRSPAVDVARLREEDARDRLRPGVARRVGFPMRTDLTPGNSGSWEELPGGDRVWRLRLETAGALWTVVGLETFRIEPGARLVAHDPASATIHGPYSAADVRRHGQLWLPPIAGDTVILELEWPAALAAREPKLRVGTVSHGYEAWSDLGGGDDGGADTTPAPDAAGACNVDVNCPAGDAWQDQKRGVVQLLSGGYAFCTGSLVNTTANDCRPYVLTAAHCNAGPSTIFRFNYERPGCESGTPTSGQLSSGASVLASYGPSDFALLEMDNAPPEGFDAYYNGWRRSGLNAFTTRGIHHPSGDVKKISYNNDPIRNGAHWGSSHWRIDEWEMGSTEPGSSGSPLFDPNHRIIGQLHGGTASCATNGWDEYGKLSASWSGGDTAATSLRDWLDPLGTGVLALDGIDGASCLAPQPDLRYAGLIVDDTQGNGNGVVEPGETVLLRVGVANEGTLAASQVLGTMSTASPLVTIVDEQAEWPAIVTGAEELSTIPAFVLQIDPGWPCGTPIDLALNLTAAESADGWEFSLSIPTGVFDESVAYAEDVEGSVAGWSIETPSGSNAWVTSETRSSSPNRSWHVGNPAAAGETLLRMPMLSGVSDGAVLRFEQYMDSEAGFDGGVLEIGLDGTTWADAGSLLLSGAYNGVIGPSQATPLTGRPAWTGDLDGWHTVIVDLSSFAGSDVFFRWRFASDLTTGDEGWYVDDVRIVVATYECAAVPSGPPGEPSAPDADAAPFHLERVDDGFRLTWEPPASGGPVTDYVLYSVPLGAPASEPVCEWVLGTGTDTILDTLPDARAFLVVARNAAGEGSYGLDSSGTPRTTAGAEACPTAPATKAATRPATRGGPPNRRPSRRGR